MTGPRIVAFATQGADSGDEQRIGALLAELSPILLSLDRGSRVMSVVRLLREIRRLDPDLVVMEGTGIAGGIAVLVGRAFSKRPYVVSSGDAVGPYLALHGRPLGLAGTLYERQLY